MRGVWLEAGDLAFRSDLPDPPAGPGEAVVRVSLAGICGTDLELRDGYAGFAGVPGHEFVGVVETAPDAEEWSGRRVVGEINAACGACPECGRGARAHCERRTVLGIRGRHGAFAERLVLPVANLHEAPRSVPDEAAVFAEPLAAALRLQEQVPVAPGTRVVVVGAGRLGLLVARTLALTGCELRVAARGPDRRSRVEALGLPAWDAASLPGRWADVAVDCTGRPEGLAVAHHVLRPRGALVLKSTHAQPAPLNLSPLVVDEITVVGSRCGPFPPALALLAEGKVAVADLVEATYPLDEAGAAYAHAARPGALKVLLRAT